MRCAVCYHGRADLYVCEGCAFGASNWDARFGHDDERSVSAGMRAAAAQHDEGRQTEHDHWRAIVGVRNAHEHGPVREVRSAFLGEPDGSPRIRKLITEHHRVDFSKNDLAALRRVPISPGTFYTAVNRRQRQKSMFLRWQRFAEVWPRIGLAVWTESLNPPPLPPRLGQELLRRIE
jgi:hypothetical protein